MKFKSISELSATLFLSSATIFLCGATAVAQSPRPAPRVNNSFRPRGRHLIYVALPGSLERPGWMNGIGIVVLDADDNYRSLSVFRPGNMLAA